MNYLRIGLALLVVASATYAASTGTGVGTGTGTGASEESGNNGISRNRGVSDLRPATWLARLAQSVPSVDSISYKNLAQMPVRSAKTLLKAVVQKNYLEPYTGPLYAPNVNQTRMYLITGAANVSVTVGNPENLSRYPLNSGEITIFITGLPSNFEDPSDAAHELVEAYRERYELKHNHAYEGNNRSWDGPSTGNLIVVDLGSQLNTFKKWATLDVEAAGEAIGRAIVNISRYAPDAHIHVIGNSVAAHVAGEAAVEYSKIMNKQLPRVTGLDPSYVITHGNKPGIGLNRGVAVFVDVIHSTSNGAGDATNGDADFYPNGRGSVTAGARNIIEAALKPLRYYAESVRRGNERNFMAVKCNTMEEYENSECHGSRIPMGYNTPVNAKGDFILRVNSNAPYGRNGRQLLGGLGRSSPY